MKKPGDQVDRYVIEAPLGKGGMGEVYEATDTRLGRRVALKLIAPGADADANQRMIREARAAASFEHPHAVVVFDVGEVDGATFLAMELVRGAPLRARVGDADVPLGRRLRWLVDVARALGAAHRHGIVHRDVKPDNVMIREDGTAKVLDFGIARRQARAVDPSAPTEAGASTLGTLTAAGVIVGTPQYAAPEQLRGETLDGRADEFAWAVMAYELCAGAMPWRAPDSVTLISQILSADPPPLEGRRPDLPAPVIAAISRALAKRPDDRFPTIDEAADAIEPFADAVTSGTGRRAPPPDLVATPKPVTVGRVVRGTGKVVFGIFALIGGAIVLAIVVGIVVGTTTGNLEVNGKTVGKPLEVTALACQDAKVDGEGVTPELREAIGHAACARLATELGVDWGGEGTALAVKAKLRKDEVRVTLRLKEREAEGKGATPVDAIMAASASLVKRVTGPAPSDAVVKSWGARDAASARRIERVWRQLLINIAPNDEEAVKALGASDPGSAWTQLLIVLVRPRGSDECKAAVRRGLELVDALPPARAHALRATFMLYEDKPDAQKSEAMRLLRLAYGEAPDDGDVAALYAAIAIVAGAPEEGFGVLDRLLARFPSKSVLALHNALGSGAPRDPERDGRYLAKLRAILPESFAWEESVRHLAELRRFDDARAALAFGRRLGLTGKSADAFPIDASQAFLEIAALEPRAAREQAARLLGDPRISVSSAGAMINAASHLLEGRVTDAEEAQLREIERQRSVGTAGLGVPFAYHLTRNRRWLGRPPPENDVLDALSRLAAEREAMDWGVGRFAVEVALARVKDKKALAAELSRIEARADKERERAPREGARLVALPLVRVVRGDPAAAKLWAEAERAPFDVRQALAIDAALALEATGSRAEAAAAYELAMHPHNAERHAFAGMIARIRLAPIRRAEGKEAEAAALEATVAKLWQKADAGLREAVLRMK